MLWVAWKEQVGDEESLKLCYEIGKLNLGSPYNYYLGVIWFCMHEWISPFLGEIGSFGGSWKLFLFKFLWLFDGKRA